MHLNYRTGKANQGVALILALVALTVVAGVGMLMFTRSLNEIKHSGDDARIVQTLMLARGGANLGAALMTGDIKAELYDVVLATAHPARWSYGADPITGVESLTPDATKVATDLEGVSRRLQDAVDPIVCDVNALGGINGSDVRLRVFFTNEACGNTNLPVDVTLPSGRYVSGPARVIRDDEDELIGIQEYAVPFVLTSEAVLGDYKRNVLIQGEYVFSVGEAPFSHYAYFTNRESAYSPSNNLGKIYFTDNTMIDGPTHTNGHFAFHLTPWFGGAVTSAGCQHSTDLNTFRNNCEAGTGKVAGAYFNGRTNLVGAGSLNNPNPNNPIYQTGGRTHQPDFSAGVAWDAQYVPLPRNSDNQARVALGTDRDDVGIHLEDDWDTITIFAGDSDGNMPTLSGDEWTPRTTHQYITAQRESDDGEWVRECTTRRGTTTCNWVWAPGPDEVVRYRFDADSNLEEWDEDEEEWVLLPLPFNGVLYIDGEVDDLTGPKRSSTDFNSSTGAQRVPPAIAHFAQMTIAGSADMRITSDLKYEDPSCSTPPTKSGGTIEPAECENLKAANVLGIYTSGGDIKIGNGFSGDNSYRNAPRDVHIHAVLMSGTNQVRVENYSQPGRGNVYLLGGLIQENRGIFGQVGGNGYDRVFTYDPRMKLGMSPPFFPTTGLGSVQDVRYLSFGQREQIY